MATYECEPTLNDAQVLDFCKNGFLMLKGVVSEETNRRTVEFLDARADAGTQPPHEPTDILDEDWFVDNVVLNVQVAGAVRSLLGSGFGLPVLVSNHRVLCPGPAQEWHVDGNSRYGPALDYLQVFYYPQDCPMEMGPTELLPGSHFLFSLQGYMGHYGTIRGSLHAVAPAGSIFLTVYNIWHRRSTSTGQGIRNNLKYNYWRTAPPTRDWLAEPGFDPATARYGLPGPRFRQQSRDSIDSAEMFSWLSGESGSFRNMGGQGWPVVNEANYTGMPYGIPSGFAGKPRI